MKFVDGGEVDDKIIVVPEDDRNNGDKYQTLEDLPKQLIEQIRFHFNHYKDLKKPGSTEVKEFAGVDVAKKVIAASIDRYIEAHPELKAKEELKDIASDAKTAFKNAAKEAKKAWKEATK